MMRKNNLKKDSLKMVLFLAGVLFMLASCGESQSSTNSDTDTSSEATISNIEQTISEVGYQATVAETGSVGLLDYQVDDAASIEPLATSCSSSNRTCSVGTGTVAWDSCTLAVSTTSSTGSASLTITMTGGWTEEWNKSSSLTNNALCQTGNLAGETTNAYVLRRSTASKATLSSGGYVTTDTLGGATWDGKTIPTPSSGEGIKVLKTGTSSYSVSGYPAAVSSTVLSPGFHKVGRSATGKKIFEYYMIPNFTLTGAKAGGNRVASGTMTIYHSLASLTTTHTFNSVTWGSSSCCFPTSGSVSTAVSNASGSAGTWSTTFSTTCGQVQFTNASGSTSTQYLSNCQ